MIQGRKKSNRLLLPSTKTQRKVSTFKEIARMMRKRDEKGRKRWALKKISNLFSEQSLAKWSLFLEDMCKDTALVMANLY